MKICAVVVVYFPDIGTLIDNIKAYSLYIDYLIIWENTPINYRKNYSKYFDTLGVQYEILSTNNNEGISIALNKAIIVAKNNGYTHILTMDQDSKWQNFLDYKNQIIKEENDLIGLYAPLVFDKVRNQIGFNSSDYAITSGMIIPLRVFDKVGFFEEKYFIDAIDTEFSLRVRSHGLKIKIIDNAVLEQNFGEMKQIKFLNSYHANYSAFRLYHIIRNHIWMWKKYKRTGLLPENYFIKYVFLRYLVREFIFTILFSNNKVKKIYSIFLGFKDGLMN